MRHFLAIYFTTVVILIMTVITLNFCIDPSGIFLGKNKSLEHKIARTLNNTQNILIGCNYDERLVQMFRIQDEKELPQYIVTGSSRTMPIGSDIISKNCLNLSVSGASLEDHIALAIAAKQKKGPNVFLLGIDPWVFNERLGPTGWESISNLYYQACSILHLKYSTKNQNLSVNKKYLQLVNYDYTTASIDKLLKKKNHDLEITSTEYPTQEKYLLRNDGSRLNSLKSTHHTQLEVDEIAEKYGRPPIYQLDNFQFSENLKTHFLALVDYLSNKGIVIFLLPPYHPKAYNSIIKHIPDVPQIEKMIRVEADKRNIFVIGSYNPYIIGCYNSDFLDGMHPSKQCWEKIFKNISWVDKSNKITHDLFR